MRQLQYGYMLEMLETLKVIRDAPMAIDALLEQRWDGSGASLNTATCPAMLLRRVTSRARSAPPLPLSAAPL
jgi:hypothetical protein